MQIADLVFNPIAGNLNAEPLVHQAAEKLREQAWKVNVIPSKSSENITELARIAANEGRQAFFISGGDGSVGSAVEGLMNSETALGVLPSGTTNVWAKELGLQGLTKRNKNALSLAAQDQASAEVQAVDLGTVNDHPFLMWAGIGADARVVQQMELERVQQRSFAVIRYILLILRNLSATKILDLEIEVDDNFISGRYVLVIITNIRTYAGGLVTLSPNACLDDGMMDLWLFSGDSGWDVLRYLLDLFVGRHINAKGVQCIPFQRLKVRSPNPLPLQLDGDPFEMGETLEIRVQPQALHILKPSQAPSSLFSNPSLSSRL